MHFLDIRKLYTQPTLRNLNASKERKYKKFLKFFPNILFIYFKLRGYSFNEKKKKGRRKDRINFKKYILQKTII